MSKLIAKNKSKKLGLFKFRKSTTDLSEWNKNDEKLLKAIEIGDVDKVQSLLQKKTLVPTKLGPRGLSVFHVACASGQIKIVDQLLQYGAEPNVLTIQGCTALQLAASNGWPQVVHKLVQIGAVVDHKDGNNLTALHHACMDAKYECVQVLLRSGADINIKDKTGKTCLFYAAHCGDFNICKELLDKGADVNTFDNHKVTPLMAAAKKGRTDVCEWLLKKGADRNFTDVQGRKALDYAMDEGHNEIKRIFEKAPTRASWDLQNDIGKSKPMQGAEGGYNVVADEMVHPDQADVVEFVQEPSPKPSPKLEHRNVVEEESSPRTLSVTSSSTQSSSEQQQQQLQQQRAMEAYKACSTQELEEEHEQLNEDLNKLTLQNRKLQDEVAQLRNQLEQKESNILPANDKLEKMQEQIEILVDALSVEKEKNQELQERLSANEKQGANKEESGNTADTWNDNEEELFDTLERKPKTEDKQTIAMLRSKIYTLEQELEQQKNQKEEEKPQTNSVNDSVEDESLDQVSQLKAELEEMQERVDALEEENKALSDQVLSQQAEVLKKMRAEENKKEEKLKKQGMVNGVEGLEGSPDTDVVQELSEENEKLAEERDTLKQDLENLRDTYDKLVQAGDNLQDMYDQLLMEKDQQFEEFEKLMQEKEEIVKENEFLLSDGNAMHDDLEKLVNELEKLQTKLKEVSDEKEDLERKLSATNVSGKASEMAKLICAWACGTNYTLERLVKTPASSVWAIDHYRNDQEVMDRSWCNVDGVRCSLKLWDTFGYHDKNRKFAYRGSDVILLCFSVVKPSSLKNVERFWVPEIKSRCPATPIVLVGTHADLRYLYKNEKYKKMNKGLLYKAVSDEDILPPMSGRDMAASIGAPYYETSVLTKYGIEELFFNVIRATLIERRALKFWNPQLRRVQYPLIQAPMDIPKPELPIIKDPGTAPHEDLSKLLQEDGDVIFDVQGTHFRAHKICLVIAESVFEGIFVHSPKANGRKSLSRQGSSGSDSGRKSEKNGGKEDKENLIGGAPPLPDICLHGTEAMTNGNCRLLNVPGFVKVEEKLWMDPLSLAEEKKTVITMDSELNPLAFQYVLRFWYSGQVPGSCDCLAELRRAAEILMLPTLILMVSNLQTGESYLNHSLESNFYTSRKNKLQSIGLESGRFTDIEFQLEDGVVALHKPILMARCEMMFAMFSANFMESSAEIIPFPGMDVQTFRVLMTYLYLGRLPSLDGSDIVGLFEAADRLCLKHMIKALEYEIVSELLQAEAKGDKIVEETLKLIEPAQFHNAVELAGWCLDYVCVNYTIVHRKYFSLLYKLQPDNQRHIAQNKWPPDWYTQEKEYYTMALRDMTPKQMIQQRHQFSRWQRCKSSCLCFGRRSRMINMENEDDAD